MNTSMGILGRKIGMTQIHDESGACIPVTAVDAGPCRVVQVKTLESDGYSAIQIGFDEKPGRNVPDALMKKAQGVRGKYDLTHGRTTAPPTVPIIRRMSIGPKSRPDWRIRNE